MSAFSSRLPEAYQDLGLWLGIGFGIIALVALCWHAVRPKTKVVSQKLPSDAKAKKYERDTNLLEALSYLISREWGGDYASDILRNEPAPQGSLDLLNIFRQAASDGEITVWGKRSKDTPWVQINRDYWETWRIDFASALDRKIKTSNYHKPSKYNSVYYELMVSKGEFEVKWSPKI